MVQALAFAELVLGGLLITSALTKETLGELLTKGISQAGKEASHGKTSETEAGVEPSGTPIPGKPGSFWGNIPSGTAAAAVKAAEEVIGTPYKWGGTNEREGFDCSGLMQYVWKKVGVSLPRTAQEQFNATTDVSKTNPQSWQPGDLLFFGNGKEISHVGMYISPGVMLDAPHTGAKVSLTHFNQEIGSKWGSENFVGIHRP